MKYQFQNRILKFHLSIEFSWEEIVISLLKLYTEKFYLSIKNKYLARHIEVSTLEEDHPNFIDEYIIQVEESETDIIRNVIEFKDKVKEMVS